MTPADSKFLFSGTLPELAYLPTVGARSNMEEN
jgi:hypothetical protein